MQVLVVGAGPAGLFCAHELSKRKGIGVTIIEEGGDVEQRHCPRHRTGFCVGCQRCELMHGVGGSGAFSDGKLNLNPEIGGNMLEFTTRADADALVEHVDSVFVSHGAKGGESKPNSEAEALVRRANEAGIRFIPIHQRHMGSDHLPRVIASFKKSLEKRGVRFMLHAKAEDITIEEGRATGLVVSSNGRSEALKADAVVLAPGRPGAAWLAGICKKLRIETRHQAIDIGVRVEVPARIMEEVTRICWDPKFHIQTKTYDDFIRTFCTCPYGFITTESYGDYVCVNGHSMRDTRSANTNFAFLVRVALTEPVENTTLYGQSIARLATTIGGGKPILQRLGDLKRGRRSTWERINKSYVTPTLGDVTPGDIGMALPARIVTDIKEGLDALSKVIPGIAEDSTLIYAPEVKFHALRVSVGKTMETNVRNLFAIGDGAGVSRGIVGAAVTGLIAAREIAGRK
jgi:uncharacterized FAD-dependent dehydrogenase